jgi:DNA-binding transcriptional LysR family regulator
VNGIESALVELGVPGGAGAATMFSRRLSRAKIKNLVAIIANGSFTAAAENLGVSAASLQRAAHDLERSLQRPLFHRTSDGLMVTHAGAQFGRAVQLSMMEIEWGIAEIEIALGNYNSRISIGALPSGGSVLLSSVLEAFIADYPRVDVRLINENLSAMTKSLREGAVDFFIGLVQENLPPDLTALPFARTPYVVAARHGHELSYKKAIKAADLLKYDWVVGLPGSGRRACFDSLFATVGLARAKVASSTLAVTRQLLEHSNRLTLLTSFELEHETDRLVAIPFPIHEPIATMGVTMRANWTRTKLHDHFIELLRQRMTQFSGPQGFCTPANITKSQLLRASR